ncbi:hypothetical protein NKG05_11605 [Oerskovia sp. M15]
MDRRTLDIAVPVTFGLLVAGSTMWFGAALMPITMVGGVLVGLYFSAFRQKLPQEVAPAPQRPEVEPPARDAITPSDSTAPWGSPPAVEDRHDDI